MNKEDAIEHLLLIVESLTGTKREIYETVCDYNLSPALARIYTALKKAGNRGMSHETLGMIAARSYGGELGVTSLATQITHLRRRLGGKEQVQSIHGYGYKLIKKEAP